MRLKRKGRFSTGVIRGRSPVKADAIAEGILYNKNPPPFAKRGRGGFSLATGEGTGHREDGLEALPACGDLVFYWIIPSFSNAFLGESYPIWDRGVPLSLMETS